MADTTFSRDVAVIGGCGHVGLPLALSFADIGLNTLIYDVNAKSVESVRAGQMPFCEEGADEMLARVLAKGTLAVDSGPQRLSECKNLILIIGTPVDEHLNPTFTAIHKAIDACLPFMRNGQTVILRSTVFPGITAHIQDYLARKGKRISVAFCPERVAQGYSLREFRELRQIVSAMDPTALAAAKELFGRIAPELVEMAPMEAELCKLMTNAWRYIQFAAVNQFYMIATHHGLDFTRILHGCRHNYPRMKGMPGPGFAAGPCLVKDTMQLAAFSQNQFVIGHSAMLINEGLPGFLVEQAKRQTNLKPATAGILGMTFKAESDDTRDSLSFKLRKLLTLECRRVMCHDPYWEGPESASLDDVMAQADVLFVGTPHHEYRNLLMPAGRVVIDPWNVVREAPPVAVRRAA